MNGEPVRAAIYIRVSTEEQAKEGYSLNAQRARNRAYCEARGWIVRNVYADEGRSAFHDVRRPEYERMLKESETWDVVVVVNMDRVWRNAKRFMEMMDRFREIGKEFVSVEDNIDTSSASGRFLMDVMARMKQFESEQIGERVLRAMDRKFADEPNTWLTRPPLGYIVSNGRLVLDADGAEIVRRIFREAISGRSTQDIADRLTISGHRGANGGKFDPVKITGILHNPAYAGYAFWHGLLRKNGHDALVSIEDFNDAQIALYLRAPRHKADEWPLILGPERIDADRIGYEWKGKVRAARYVPKEKPASLDALIAEYQRARAQAVGLRGEKRESSR